jgi:pyrroloquinoline quinone biosynthesis protein D
LRHDTAHERWTILAPVRVCTPDAVAAAVLKLCDGSRAVEEIAAELAQSHGAPRETIFTDITAMLQGSPTRAW